MREQFIHFVWQYRRFNHSGLKTTEGLPVEIIKQGKLNEQDGPDFLDARIRIGDTIWAGHVEIHVKSSDWIRHKHASDPKYKNVILHVVYEHDREDLQLGFPTLELSGLIPRSIYERYLFLMQSASILPCHHLISEVDESVINIYKSRLLVERMEDKIRKIEILLEQTRYDWDQVSWIWLVRYFGSGVNCDTFQELAAKVRFQWISRLSGDPADIQALLMGMAGLLAEETEEEYVRDLKIRYDFLVNKWNLQPVPPFWWRWKQSRPAAFPSLRLAQLAVLMENMHSIFREILDVDALKLKITRIRPESYWNEHYRLNKASVYKVKPLTIDFANRLIINVSVPLMLAYARYSSDAAMIESAFSVLDNLPAEDNKITRMMSDQGFSNNCASDSQAILHLKHHYCDQKKCLNCVIGNKIITTRQYEIGISDVNLEIHEACV